MSWFTESGSTFDMGPRFLLLDTNRQSSISGLYMAGDVTGTPEIKAAINTGAEVARSRVTVRRFGNERCDESRCSPSGLGPYKGGISGVGAPRGWRVAERGPAGAGAGS